MQLLRRGLAIVAAFLPVLAFAQAQTEARLYLEKASARPGEIVSAIVELRMPAGWHTYWRNPSELGGVGTRTKVKWSLPEGFVAGDLEWPTPEKRSDPAGDSHIYEDVVRLLASVRVPETARRGPVDLNAEVSWLECKEECVPGKGRVAATLTVGDAGTSAGHEAEFAAARKALPTLQQAPEATAKWAGPPAGETRTLEIEWRTDAADPDFFAFESKAAPLMAKTELVKTASGVVLRKAMQKPDDGWPATVSGLLVAHSRDAARIGSQVTLPISDGTTAAGTVASPGGVVPASGGVDWPSLASMLGLAFLGGLILNIMPCVLPVLALKILGFVRQAGSNPGRVRKLGLVYGAGVITSFLVLGGVSLGVQAAGGVAGWSTAFQNPQFRVAMCVLLVLVALNLFGVFEVTLAGGAMSSAGQLASQEGAGGAFFNGVLAAVLATPCTAPFLATAIAFAFTQPPLVLLLIFLTVGLGLAAPFVVLCWKPGWLKLMPKPGDWMTRFKTVMGFPVLGTAMWIFWFTAKRMGDTGVLWFGLFLVVVALAAWVWGEFAQRAGRPGAAAAAVAVLLAGGYFGLLEYEIGWRAPGGYRKSTLDWQVWSAAKVDAERQKGRPVLVDFTADNCANCKFNKATSIEIASTIAKLQALHVATMEGDFTDADPVIAEVLKQFGRRGVPLVLVYPKNPSLPPRALPVALTPSVVQEALDWAAQ